jgi:hypothetical protein
MARSSNSTPETLVPVAEIAGRLGLLPEMIAGRVRQSDLRHDWDGAACVEWSAAKSLYKQMIAEKEAGDREQHARMAKQMDEEQYAREYPLRAFEDAQRQNRIDGVQVSVPDADADWMPE